MENIGPNWNTVYFSKTRSVFSELSSKNKAIDTSTTTVTTIYLFLNL